MRSVSILYSLLFLFSYKLFAAEHTIATQINYHSDQDANFGYGIFYQYKFLENFEFEVKYGQSSDLKIVTHDNVILGNYSSLSSGINFIKQRSPKLSLKVGFGLNTVTSSSNSFLLEESSIAPYFQISTNYKVSKKLSLTFGQTSKFHHATLGIDHSLFISMNWLFGNEKLPVFVKTNKTIKPLPVVEELTPQIISPRPLVDNPLPHSLPHWYVQIGAYVRNENAQHSITVLQEAYSLILNIRLHEKLYRVLSHSFTDKISAEQYLQYLQTHFNLSGFVNKI
jgi:hypothetical protein